MVQPLLVPDPVRSQSDLVPVPVRCSSAVVPDCERLDVYRVAVELQLAVSPILTGRGLRALRGQLDRASVSIVLNIAEGSGRFTPADKAHFYLIARGSALESLAALSLMAARSVVAPELYRHARALLLRIVAMLTRLTSSMQARDRARRRD